MATQTQIINIRVDVSDGIKQIQQITDEITTLQSQQAALRNGTEQERQQYARNAVAIREYTRQRQVLTREVQNEVRASQSAMGAYSQLQNEYARASARARDLAASNTASTREIRNATNAAATLGARLREVDASIGQHQRNVGNYTSALSGIGVQIGRMAGLTAIVAGIGAAFKDAFNTIKDFDKQMAQVAAITMATKEEMKQLRDIAIQYGGSTKFTAGEVAGLEAELGKLGYTTQQIIDATGGVTMAAAATGESLQKTAEIVGSVTMAFGLSASESQRVADVMSQSFNATALGLDNFSESIKYVAPVAKQAGISLEETTAMLGVLANNGLKGSMAGTALRQIMGELVGAGGNLQDKLAKLSKEGLNLAGAQDEVGRSAKTALLVLKDNVAILPKLTTEFENSAGASEIAAAKMMDTISGKTTFLKSTWDGFILSLEDGNGVLSRFLKKVLEVTAQAISGFQRLTMSIEDKNKAEGQSMATKRLKEFEKELSMQEDKSKYVEQEIIAEKNLIKAKEDKIKVLKNELIENEKKGFFMQSTGLKKANEEEIKGLRQAANNSIAYVNALGNLRRAKQDQTTIDLKNQAILDKNNEAGNKTSVTTTKLTEAEKTRIKKEEEKQRIKDLHDYFNSQESIFNENIRKYKKSLEPAEQTLLDKVTQNGIAVLNASIAKNAAITANDKEATDQQIAEAERLKQAKIQGHFDVANAAADVLDGAFAFSNAVAKNELDLWAKQNKGKANFDEEYAKKKAKLDHDAAVRNKTMQVVNAIINGAAGVVAQLGQGNIPLAIAAGLASALQIATIIATPIPSPESTGGASGGGGGVATLPPDLTSKMATPLNSSVTDIQTNGGSNAITSGAANISSVPTFDYTALATAVSNLPAPELSIVELKTKQKQVDFIDNISTIKT